MTEQRARILRLSLATSGMALTSACFMAGNYQTARTLPKGQSSFGMNVSVTDLRVPYTDPNTGQQQTADLRLPEFVPELAYHLGITDDFEFGGRLAPGALGIGLDGKWRLLHAGGLHLAIDPELTYQGLLIKADGGRLNGIATLDVADNLSLNGAVFGGVVHLSSPFNTSNVSLSSATLAQTGVSLGVQLRGEVFWLMPAIEWDDYVWSSNASSDRFQTFNVVVAMAWIQGREIQKLNQMDQKLDRIQNTLDGQQYQGPPPPSPAPAPMPPAGPPPPPPVP